MYSEYGSNILLPINGSDRRTTLPAPTKAITKAMCTSGKKEILGLGYFMRVI